VTDLAARDLVHVSLGRGRDNAASLSDIAERLHLTRRQCEQAVQALRLDGIAVASGSDGVWIGDWQDMAATAAMLNGRLVSQVATIKAVEATTGRLRAAQYQQTTLGLVA
jgi:hypothetical protein